MAFKVAASPGITVREIDLTTVARAAEATDGFIAGVFNWGPADEVITVDNEDTLKRIAGKPVTLKEAISFLSSASFLAYTDKLRYVRVSGNTSGIMRNAISYNGTDPNSGVVQSFTVEAVNGQNTIDIDVTDDALGSPTVTPNPDLETVMPVGTVLSIEGEYYIVQALDTPPSIDEASPGAPITRTVTLNRTFTGTTNAAAAITLYANLSESDLVLIKNDDAYDNAASLPASDFIAKYPGEFGNVLEVHVCAGADQYSVALGGTFALTKGSKDVVYTQTVFGFTNETTITSSDTDGTVIANTTGGSGTGLKVELQIISGVVSIKSISDPGSGYLDGETITVDTSGLNTPVGVMTFDTVLDVLSDYFNAGDFLEINNVKYVVASITNDTNLKLGKAFIGATTTSVSGNRVWKYSKFFGSAPTTGHAHLVVVDSDGTFSEVADTIVKTYFNVAVGAGLENEINEDGSANWWKTAVERQDSFILPGDGDLSAYSTDNKAVKLSFTLGADGNASYNTDEYIDAYEYAANAETIDVSLIIAPDLGSQADNATIANYITDNICEVRKDCMSFTAPNQTAVVNNKDNEVADSIAFRNLLTSSSYTVMVDNWKYIYDKYNDTYRWIPLSADIAGLTARTEQDRAPWYSPAGFSRGIIKNVVKLAWSAKESQRDDLYNNSINSVVNFTGTGNVLFGDRTLNSNQTSAFASIGVRRLFIVVEKTIANAAKFQLFEFNDEFTRAQFISIVEPYLRSVKAGRGIQDFVVQCDDKNNTGQVIDQNGFVGDIYIKPARSINFITLNFVAVRTDVSFDEVVGTI